MRAKGGNPSSRVVRIKDTRKVELVRDSGAKEKSVVRVGGRSVSPKNRKVDGVGSARERKGAGESTVFESLWRPRQVFSRRRRNGNERRRMLFNSRTRVSTRLATVQRWGCGGLEEVSHT